MNRKLFSHWDDRDPYACEQNTNGDQSSSIQSNIYSCFASHLSDLLYSTFPRHWVLFQTSTQVNQPWWIP